MNNIKKTNRKIVCAIVLIVTLIAIITSDVNAGQPVLDKDGQVFFPLGWYDYIRPENFEVMKAMGCNAVSWWGSSTDPEVVKYWLNLAKYHNIKVIIGVPIEWRNMNASQQALLSAWVAAIKDNDALLAYKIGDENNHPTSSAFTSAKALIAYNIIKGVDPTRQVTQVFGGSSSAPENIQTFLQSTDVVERDSYNILSSDAEFQNVTKFNKDFTAYNNNANITAKSGVVAVHQGYGGEPLYAAMRLPTYNEFRYEAFSSLTLKARGNWWWTYSITSEQASGPNFMANVATPVIHQYAQLIPSLQQHYNVGTITSNRDSDTQSNGFNDVTYIMSADRDYYYLVVANNTSGTISATVNVSNIAALANLTADVIGEARTKAFTQDGSGYHVTESMTKYDINIYKLTKLTPEPKTCDDEIDEDGGLTGDVNEDCYIDFSDYAEIAEQWQSCNDPQITGCM
ncbi:MAG: hypothetical protein A2Y12_20530 [Planctomycetes bacterium GWF2_42_9]|nr:MAG: hypothetical protein A2Y12_20530 [Planctomycetes bacterium GWF2_42_9]